MNGADYQVSAGVVLAKGKSYCVECSSAGGNPCADGQTCYDRIPTAPGIGPSVISVPPYGSTATDGRVVRNVCRPLSSLDESCEVDAACSTGFCSQSVNQPHSGVCAGCSTRSPWGLFTGLDASDAACADAIRGSVCISTYCGAKESYQKFCNRDAQCQSNKCDIAFTGGCLCSSDAQCGQDYTLQDGTSAGTTPPYCGSAGYCVQCTEDSHCAGKGVFHVCAAGSCI